MPLYYAVLGVSYLNFTTILDALISLLSLVTDNYVIIIVLLVMLGLLYLYFTRLMPYMFYKLKDKRWYQKITNTQKTESRLEKTKENNNLYKLMAIMFFMMFLSLRLGMGLGTKSRITKSTGFQENYQLVFTDGTSENVKKMGQNSIYFFYVRRREPVVVATPILENIKEIKRIKKLK